MLIFFKKIFKLQWLEKHACFREDRYAGTALGELLVRGDAGQRAAGGTRGTAVAVHGDGAGADVPGGICQEVSVRDHLWNVPVLRHELQKKQIRKKKRWEKMKK